MGKGGSKLLKRDAEDIAKKLEAATETGSNHIHALVRYNGVLIAQFGIRHARKAKHGHIPSQLFVSETEALALARCTMSKEQYFEKLRQKNKLPTEAAKPQATKPQA